MLRKRLRHSSAVCMLLHIARQLCGLRPLRLQLLPQLLHCPLLPLQQGLQQSLGEGSTYLKLIHVLLAILDQGLHQECSKEGGCDGETLYSCCLSSCTVLCVLPPAATEQGMLQDSLVFHQIGGSLACVISLPT